MFPDVAMLTLLLVKERRGEQENPPLFRLRRPDRTAERAGSGPRAIVCPRLSWFITMTASESFLEADRWGVCPLAPHSASQEPTPSSAGGPASPPGQ